MPVSFSLQRKPELEENYLKPNMKSLNCLTIYKHKLVKMLATLALKVLNAWLAVVHGTTVSKSTCACHWRTQMIIVQSSQQFRKTKPPKMLATLVLKVLNAWLAVVHGTIASRSTCACHWRIQMIIVQSSQASMKTFFSIRNGFRLLYQRGRTKKSF